MWYLRKQLYILCIVTHASYISQVTSQPPAASLYNIDEIIKIWFSYLAFLYIAPPGVL